MLNRFSTIEGWFMEGFESENVFHEMLIKLAKHFELTSDVEMYTSIPSLARLSLLPFTWRLNFKNLILLLERFKPTSQGALLFLWIWQGFYILLKHKSPLTEILLQPGASHSVFPSLVVVSKNLWNVHSDKLESHLPALHKSQFVFINWICKSE